MSTPRKTSRRTLREVLRMLFANFWFLTIMVVIGGAAGWVFSRNQERTYLGHVKLKSSTHTGMAEARLPEEDLLYEMVFDDENLRTLLPEERPQADPALLQALKVKLERAEEGISVWQLTAQIPAGSSQAAEAQLRRFVEKLQANFAAKYSASVVRQIDRLARRVRLEDPQAFSFLNVSATDDELLWATAEVPVDESATEEAKPKSSDSVTQSLEDEARKLGVSLDSLAEALETAQTKAKTRDQALRDLERQLDHQQNVLKLLMKDQLPTSLPEDFRREYPEFAIAIDQVLTLEQQRAALAARLKPAHPRLKALDRSLQQAREQLHAKLEKLVSQFESEVEQLLAQAKKDRQSCAQSNERAKQLSVLLRRKQDLQAEQAQQHQQQQLVEKLRQLAQLPLPADRGPAPATKDASQQQTQDTPAGTTTPPIDAKGPPAVEPAPPTVKPAPPAPLPIGDLYFALSIDKRPLQPQTTRNMLVGSLASLALGLLLVLIRTAADQRIHLPHDMEGMEIDVEALGSIPQVKRMAPVRLVNSDGF